MDVHYEEDLREHTTALWGKDDDASRLDAQAFISCRTSRES